MKDSNDPTDPEGTSPTPGRTEIQPQAEIAASKELSVPKEVEQHAAAPKIPGYVLTKALGRGAFAEVWKAWQVRTHKWVAVKVFTQRKGVNWIFLQREVERLIKLDKHPNIVSLLDADLTGEPAYYVLDFLEGGHVWVADFGQSRIVTDSAGALGTLFYLAPEDNLGKRGVLNIW